MLLKISKIKMVSAVFSACFFYSPWAVAQLDEPIKPIPLNQTVPENKAELGGILFHDKRLSKDNTISCASCHNLTQGGADSSPLSNGVGQRKGDFNSPTIFNSGFNFRQFWDGRSPTLEDQVAGPIHNPKEMDTNWPEIIEKLKFDVELDKKFKSIYSSGISVANIQDAIAAFERDMTTPNARFDKYLRGDSSAITSDELKGYQLFKKNGCVACHQGVNVGGNMFQTFGVMGDYFKKRGNITEADLGRYNVTKKESDKHVFKVPSLRNVGLTAPYFHDGSAQTLKDAIDVMFQYQLGRNASEEDKALIEKFLLTLTGELKGKSLESNLKLVK